MYDKSLKAKVVGLDDFKLNRNKQKNYRNENDDLNDIVVKLNQIINEKVDNQSDAAPHILELERKCECMKEKLNHAIPYHTLAYMCINSFVFAISIFMIYLRYCKGVYIVDPYYLICTCLITIGLFTTALLSLRDWKEYLNQDETESKI